MQKKGNLALLVYDVSPFHLIKSKEHDNFIDMISHECLFNLDKAREYAMLIFLFGLLCLISLNDRFWDFQWLPYNCVMF